MTEQQALQKMKKDIMFRGLAESTYKNYARNVKKFFSKEVLSKALLYF